MREEVFNQVALSLVPGLGPVNIRQLISYCGSATEVLNTSAAKLLGIPGIGEKTIHALSVYSPAREAARQVELARSYGVKILTYTDDDYPHRLKQMGSAPVVLYVKGNLSSMNSPRTVGIVGTRKATDYGRKAVARILGQLQEYLPTIISGLAYGIDITAHREALMAGLPTIAVLGSSLDRIYPSSHQQTVQKMLADGSVISELKLGTKAESYHFPHRNRIIAGLSDALIIVEARNKGGALITAEYLRGYGRPCFAIPGPINSAASAGCNHLLKTAQATMITRGQDVAEMLAWTKEKHSEIPDAGDSEELILKILRRSRREMHIDELSRKSLIPVNKISGFILYLELKGLIKALPGKKFVLVGK